MMHITDLQRLPLSYFSKTALKQTITLSIPLKPVLFAIYVLHEWQKKATAVVTVQYDVLCRPHRNTWLRPLPCRTKYQL